MGKIDRGVRCNVVGCNEEAIRSISPEKVASAGLSIGEARRAYLCPKHYKEMKKKLKKQQMLEKWRMSA